MRSGRKKSIIREFKTVMLFTAVLLLVGSFVMVHITLELSKRLSYQYLDNSGDRFLSELQRTYISANNINALLNSKSPFIRYLYSEDLLAKNLLNDMASEIVYLRGVNPYISDISVVGFDRMHPVLLKKSVLEDLKNKLQNHTGITCLITETPIYGSRRNSAAFISYALNIYHHDIQKGAIIISFSPEQIYTTTDSEVSLDADFVFIDSFGRHLSFGDPKREQLLLDCGKKYGKQLAENSASFTFPADGSQFRYGPYLVNMYYIPPLNGYLITGIDYTQLLPQYADIWLLLLLIGLMIIAVTVYITYSFYTRFVLPLRALSHNLSEQSGYYNHPEYREIPGCSELSSINREFYNVLQTTFELNRRIFQTQEQLYEQDRRQKITELAMYRSQVNPHFLANALELVSSCGDRSNDPSVRDISAAVSRIYRYSAHITEPATVADELNILNDYIHIQNQRYGPELSIITFFPEDTLDLSIIRMLLQPMVENSISHGFSNRGYHGTIYVGASIQDNMLVIDIRDDGTGIPPEQLHFLREEISNPTNEGAAHIGLRNTAARIRLVYGEPYGLTIDSEIDNGTVISMKLPVIRQNS